MRLQLIRMGSGFVTLALFAGAPATAIDAGTLAPSATDAMAQAASPQAIAEYRRKLKEYEEARAAFEEEAGAYWSAISEKRKGRNAKRRERQTIALDDYVLTQPPVYSGPKRPVNPEPEEEKPPRWKKFEVGTCSRIACGMVTMSRPVPSPVRFIISSSAAESGRL